MGLHLLKALPETTERIAQERTMQLALGRALLATKGYAGGSRSRYTRPENCVSRSAEPPAFPVLFGLWQFYVLRGDLQVARELGDSSSPWRNTSKTRRTCWRPTGRWRSPASRWARWPSPGRTRNAVLASITQQHHAPAFMYGQTLGHPVWPMPPGSLAPWLSDQALQRSHQMLRLAHELSHPFSLAHALYFASLLHQHRREVQEARECADALIAPRSARL